MKVTTAAKNDPTLVLRRLQGCHSVLDCLGHSLVPSKRQCVHFCSGTQSISSGSKSKSRRLPMQSGAIGSSRMDAVVHASPYSRPPSSCQTTAARSPALYYKQWPGSHLLYIWYGITLKSLLTPCGISAKTLRCKLFEGCAWSSFVISARRSSFFWWASCRIFKAPCRAGNNHAAKVPTASTFFSASETGGQASNTSCQLDSIVIYSAREKERSENILVRSRACVLSDFQTCSEQHFRSKTSRSYPASTSTTPL